MEAKRHLLQDIWEQYPKALSTQYFETSALDIEQLLIEMGTLGPSYYYTLHICNGTINHFDKRILQVHGLTELPDHLKDIIDLVHPDDIDFVREAENWTIIKMFQLGIEHQMNFKSGYCFRMMTADGTYQLFHHQAIHSIKDEYGAIAEAINIHTNIHHITQHNNYIATLTGIGYRNDFHQFHYHPTLPLKPIDRLTKRELEVLIMLSKGYSDKQIADSLVISYHTVRTHHKNILKKTMSKNSSELVKTCFEHGFI